jgi:hypothetical protein
MKTQKAGLLSSGVKERRELLRKFRFHSQTTRDDAPRSAVYRHAFGRVQVPA